MHMIDWERRRGAEEEGQGRASCGLLQPNPTGNSAAHGQGDWPLVFTCPLAFGSCWVKGDSPDQGTVCEPLAANTVTGKWSRGMEKGMCWGTTNTHKNLEKVSLSQAHPALTERPRME